MSTSTLPADRAVDAYLDDLLAEPLPSAEPAAVTVTEVPSWPPSASDYLVCVAAGVRVAVPMSQVDDVLPAPLAGSERLHSGHFRSGDEALEVIDLAGLLTERLQEPEADMLVVLSGRRWALACRIEEEALRIDGSEVHWRCPQGERRSRPWLGGMHKDGRCALLDVQALQCQSEQTRADTLSR